MMFSLSIFFPRISSFVSPYFRAASIHRMAVKLSGSTLYMSTTTDDKKDSGHQSGSSAPALSPDDQKLVEIFQKHQSTATKLPLSEDIRTLIQYSNGYGVISTNSVKYEGYPTGSVVGFSLDDNGNPFFVFSSMSAHTTDIAKDGRMSLTVTANEFKGAADGRAVLIGDVSRLPQDKVPAYRENYKARHSDAFWIDFGDFTYFIMDNIKSVRFVGGFARAGEVSGADYLASKPDPLYPVAKRVMSHMNLDHEDALIAMVNHYVGVPASSAQMVSMDRLGITLTANLTIAGGSVNKVRIPYPREVSQPKAVKEMLVEMTNASK
jgi:putative heme iron utilization protein